MGGSPIGTLLPPGLAPVVRGTRRMGAVSPHGRGLAPAGRGPGRAFRSSGIRRLAVPPAERSSPPGPPPAADRGRGGPSDRAPGAGAHSGGAGAFRRCRGRGADRLPAGGGAGRRGGRGAGAVLLAPPVPC